MSFYGKGFATFGKFAGKRVKKPTKYEGRTGGKQKKVKETKKTPIPKKKPEKKKQFKEPSEREIFDSDVDAFKERMIRKGYTPRGKDVQREVNAYMNRHPLRESAIPKTDKGLAPDNLSAGRVTEQQRKRYLEFRQAKINAAKRRKKDG